jgi:hypothetical protein
LVVYYESIKQELKKRPIYEYRCDERLKTKVVLRWENTLANRPVRRETGLEIPCSPSNRPVVGPNHSKLS